MMRFALVLTGLLCLAACAPTAPTAYPPAETGRPGQAIHGVIVSRRAIDTEAAPTAAQLKTLHTCIKKVTEDLDGMRFNTAISALMVFINEAMAWETKPVAALRDFLALLQPFSPHLAEDASHSRKLSFGWYVDMNNSESTMKNIIQQACDAAGARFGKDVLLQF